MSHILNQLTSNYNYLQQQFLPIATTAIVLVSKIVFITKLLQLNVGKVIKFDIITTPKKNIEIINHKLNVNCVITKLLNVGHHTLLLMSIQTATNCNRSNKILLRVLDL